METKNMGHDDVINEIFKGPNNFRKLLRDGVDFSKLLRGYGPKKTKELIKHYNTYYGNEHELLFELKEEFPDMIITDNIEKSIDENSEEIRKSLDFVSSFDCGPSLKEKIILKVLKLLSTNSRGDMMFYNELYGVKEDPLILRDFISISLKKVDELALVNKWWDKDSFYRYYSYCKVFVQKYCEKEGSVYFQKRDLEKYVREELRKSHSEIDVDFVKVSNSIERLENEDYIFKRSEKGPYYYRDYYEKEKEILTILKNFRNITFTNDILDRKILCDEKITDEQLDAINGIRKHLISNLNGPGGSGKTDCVIKKLCELIGNNEYETKKIIFTAPTHAAKKNGLEKIGLREIIDYSVVASLTYEYNETEYDDFYQMRIDKGYTNKLKTILTTNDIEYMIIDESSMLSMLDYYSILTTIDEYLNEFGDREVHIVFIGDQNQLQPVGVGNPYKALLDKIPTFRLTKNFRANKSPDLCSFLDLTLNKTKDYDRWNLDEKTQRKFSKDVGFYFTKDYITILSEQLENLKKRGIEPYNGNNENDCFQVICPWGNNSNPFQYDITVLIRSIFKKDDSEEFYKKGDYVTFSKNARGLFYNNDMGEIIDKDSSGYTIKLSNPSIDKKLINKEDSNNSYKEVADYKIKILSESVIFIPHKKKGNINGEHYFLKSNYCRTVHSVQGLQFSNVLYVVPHVSQFLNINMNYTAYSRAKDKLILIGDKRSFDGEYSKKKAPDINTILKFKDSILTDIDKTLSNDEQTLISQNLDIDRCLNIKKDKKFKKWTVDFGFNTEGECYDCKKNITINNYHVFLKDEYGNHDIDNLKCICRWCFNKKR